LISNIKEEVRRTRMKSETVDYRQILIKVCNFKLSRLIAIAEIRRCKISGTKSYLMTHRDYFDYCAL